MVINQYKFILQFQKNYLSLLKSFLFSPSRYFCPSMKYQRMLPIVMDVVTLVNFV